MNVRLLDFDHGFENVDEDEYDYYSRAFGYDYGVDTSNDDVDWFRNSMKFNVVRPPAGLMEISGYKNETDTRSLFKRIITAVGRFVVGTIKFVIKYSVLLGIWTALFIWINHITVQDPTVEEFGRMIIELITRFRAFIFNLF